MLYISLMYEKKRESEYLRDSKVGMQVADNILQWNILDGFIDNLGEGKIHVLNSIPVGTFPKYNRKVYFENEKYFGKNSVEIHNFGFLNLPVIKPIMRYSKYVRTLKNYLKTEQHSIVIYGLYLPQLLAIKKLKKMYKSLDVTVIIDDLPTIYGIVSGNRLVKYIKNIIGKYVMDILNDSQYITHFVFLTRQMSEVINLGKRNYSIMEGVAGDVGNLDLVQIKPNNDKNIILYAGTLNPEFGIIFLLKAFQLIEDQRYELWICGTGDAEQEVLAYSKNDSRIKFHGFVTKEQVNALQRQAKVLVNPRKNDAEYTKYSFPSKTIEYILAEKPVVMYQLSGIPEEYTTHLYYVQGDDESDLARKIVEVCNQDPKDLQIKAKKSKEWILKEKNAKAQVKKIIMLWEK